MPPKAKCTKEQIVSTAFDMVRASGMSVLTARNLAKELGTSTAPIFTLFNTVEEIQNEVISRANVLYSEYIRKGLSQTLAFKGAGMKYIEFAKDEPELFKLLFLSENAETQITHFLPYYDAHAPEILETVEKSCSADKEKAKKIYNHMSVYAFGFASLFAQKIYMFTLEDISLMMTEVFNALESGEKL